MVATVWPRRTDPPPMTPAVAEHSARSWRSYHGCLVIYAASGYWPISRVQRDDKRGMTGCPTEPAAPPANLSDERLARVRRLLERQGYTLIWSPAQERWLPVRMI
jgi:hypothetical protein